MINNKSLPSSGSPSVLYLDMSVSLMEDKERKKVPRKIVIIRPTTRPIIKVTNTIHFIRVQLLRLKS